MEKSHGFMIAHSFTLSNIIECDIINNGLDNGIRGMINVHVRHFGGEIFQPEVKFCGDH